MPTQAPTIPPQEPTVVMQFGVSLDQSSLLFFACLFAAIGLVFLSCQKQFGERSITENDDYVYQFLPRHLATREEYSKGFLIYFGTMAATVVLLSLVGPKNLASLGIPLPKEIGYVVVPLALAFMLVTVLPTVPGLLEIEKWLRKYAHEQAYIPAAARATAERLTAADFDFSAYEGEALQSPEMRGVEPADFTRSRRSLEHDWARLSCLVYEQKSRRMAGLLGALDADLVHYYEKDLDSIEDKKRSMEAEVAAYRAEKANNPAYANEPLRRAIRGNLYKLYILLGCAVRLKRQPHDDINLALRQFGFKLDHVAPKPSNADLKLVCVAVAAVGILAAGFAAVGLGRLRLWTPSLPFPSTFFQPFLDSASTLIPYVVAIMVADLMRQRAVRKGWRSDAAGPKRRANLANYIRVALVCGVAAYLALVLWGLAFAQLTVTGLKMDMPVALLAMATGGFYVYHLDNVETGMRPSRRWEIGAQTVLTGMFGFIGACATWEIALGSAGLAFDKIVLQTVISAMVGLLLAWCIPEAAAAAGYDPLAEAKDERLRMLEAAARDRFADAPAAANWLERQHPALGYRSPRAAAADLEGFERAIDLLQHPRALAA